MLKFYSSSNSVVNSRRAVDECIENALGVENTDCDLIIFYTTIGHDYEELLEQFHGRSPSARIVGCTGSGVIGVEGPNETMRSLAIMAIRGATSEFAIASLDSIAAIDSYDVGVKIARELVDENPDITMIHFLPAAVDILPADRAIAGIESVFGANMPIFGGCALDNVNFVSSFQFVDDRIIERGAVAVGFADPTLEIIMQATHGHDIVGDPFVVTRSVGNRIYELDGKPAWTTLVERAGLEETIDPKSLEAAALWSFAHEIPEELHEEYRNRYMVSIGGWLKQSDGSILSLNDIPVGTKIWMTQHNEDRIFSGVDAVTKGIVSRNGGRTPVAVFHADCAARGRFLFNRVLKEELVGRMQYPLIGAGDVPWIGFYCAGEFCAIGERNWFHGYTTSIFAMYRRSDK